MTTLGWLLLAVSCGSVTWLVAFCLLRVLRLPDPAEELHAPLDIDTHDLDGPRQEDATLRSPREPSP